MQKLSRKPDEEISMLITDMLSGVINEEGLIKLNQWLLEDEAHLEHFNTLKFAWLLSGKSTSYSDENIHKNLERIKADLKKKKTVKLKPSWTFSKIAASWIIALLIGGTLSALLWMHTSENKMQLTNTTITAPLGARSVVDLPDGSRVWVNAGSRITYNSNYGNKNRNINLVGEAYFSVKTNKEIPFLVKTSDIVVKALGTKFNVKAYPDEKTITTTLEEGKVVLSSLHKTFRNEVAELKPNQMITYYKKGGFDKNMQNPKMFKQERISVSNDGNIISLAPDVKTKLMTSWKDDTWIIEGQPLDILVPILERRYNVEIKFNSENIRDFKFNGKIQKETIEQIMAALELSAPITYDIKDNIIHLSLNRRRLEQYNKNTKN